VGIHDLRHDGRLYQSDKEFRRNAVSINRYLAEWGAVGFRSAFMLHKLDWLHQLNVAYDASTFDTDPFEPQPEGRHTIFPFWVPHRIAIHESRVTNDSADSRPGYVELPYTLPQDSTLFLLLREQTIDIWLRKLDWIAKHSGMALVIIHPDYFCFDGAVEPDDQYPCSRYNALLEYLRKQYEGAFWNGTPGEVAEFYVRAMKIPTAAAAEA
jgi:hypothetical protein